MNEIRFGKVIHPFIFLIYMYEVMLNRRVGASVEAFRKFVTCVKVDIE